MASKTVKTGERPISRSLHELLSSLKAAVARGASVVDQRMWVCKVAAHHSIRVCTDTEEDSARSFSSSSSLDELSSVSSGATTRTASSASSPLTVPASPRAATQDPSDLSQFPTLQTTVAAAKTATESKAARPGHEHLAKPRHEDDADLASLAALCTDRDSESDLGSETSGDSRASGPRRRRKLPAEAYLPSNGMYQISIDALFSPDRASRFTMRKTSARLNLSVGRLTRLIAPIQSECNGVVIDAATWEPLAIPPRAFRVAPPTGTRDGVEWSRVVNTYLGRDRYDIVRVDDGTVLTLYSYVVDTDAGLRQIEWGLATSNGFDVSKLCWMGSRTYAEIFFSLAPPELRVATGLRLADGRLRFDRLDSGSCYTVGIRHHDFHPLVADPARMWQIQTARLDTKKVSYSGGLPGVPWQTLVDPRSLAGKGATWPTVETLRAFGVGALDRARAFMRGGPPTEFHYGFILRSKNAAETGCYSDILIESDLLTKVREIVYEQPEAGEERYITSTNRLQFQAMRAFLDARNREIATDLFPQWGGLCSSFDSHLGRIMTDVRAQAPDALVTTLVKHAKKHISGFDAARDESLGKLRDMLSQREHAVVLLKHLETVGAKGFAKVEETPPPTSPTGLALDKDSDINDLLAEMLIGDVDESAGEKKE
jgi:hypothetical protein